MAISAVNLLKMFLDVEEYQPERFRRMVVIHLVFVVWGVLRAPMGWNTVRTRGTRASKMAIIDGS